MAVVQASRYFRAERDVHAYPVLQRRGGMPADVGAMTEQAIDRETLDEIHADLSRRQKRLPTRLLYDAQGSRLFEAICELPEYYATRTELQILRDNAASIAAFAGTGVIVVEPGAGAGLKSKQLLRSLRSPRCYMPIDIDDDVLSRCAAEIRADRPLLDVQPLHADFTEPFYVPARAGAGPRLLFFPGSTIGNFDPPAARTLLRRFRDAAGPNGGLLIGVDLRKNASTLRHAYDDEAGVTARFNLNLLTRINRDFDADFDINAFAHRAVYDKRRHRIEMHLVSLWAQRVVVSGRRYDFIGGETIHTENSCKYLPRQFATLASSAGWRWEQLWMDAQRRFGVFGFRA